MDMCIHDVHVHSTRGACTQHVCLATQHVTSPARRRGGAASSHYPPTRWLRRTAARTPRGGPRTAAGTARHPPAASHAPQARAPAHGRRGRRRRCRRWARWWGQVHVRSARAGGCAGRCRVPPRAMRAGRGGRSSRLRRQGQCAHVARIETASAWRMDGTCMARARHMHGVSSNKSTVQLCVDVVLRVVMERRDSAPCAPPSLERRRHREPGPRWGGLGPTRRPAAPARVGQHPHQWLDRLQVWRCRTWFIGL